MALMCHSKCTQHTAHSTQSTVHSKCCNSNKQLWQLQWYGWQLGTHATSKIATLSNAKCTSTASVYPCVFLYVCACVKLSGNSMPGIATCHAVECQGWPRRVSSQFYLLFVRRHHRHHRHRHHHRHCFVLLYVALSWPGFDSQMTLSLVNMTSVSSAVVDS